VPGRRSSEDELWQEVRETVRKRDKTCRIERCLTLTESKRVKIGPRRNLDCAHVLSASSRPDLVYSLKNVLLVSREFHRRLDDCQDPLNGDPIDLNERSWWWWRALTCSTEKFDLEVDYSERVDVVVTKCDEGT
jgi:hypothetical protein